MALALTALPLPSVVAPYRPEWVPLILIFWSLLAPERFSLLTAFWMGLLLDTLSGALLGQHALALVVVVAIVRCKALATPEGGLVLRTGDSSTRSYTGLPGRRV